MKKKIKLKRNLNQIYKVNKKVRFNLKKYDYMIYQNCIHLKLFVKMINMNNHMALC